MYKLGYMEIISYISNQININMFQDEEEEEVKRIKTPNVPFHLSKKLSSIEGTDTIYFIDKTWGLNNGLQTKMNFTSVFPTDEDFCEITIPIIRYE